MHSDSKLHARSVLGVAAAAAAAAVALVAAVFWDGGAPAVAARDRPGPAIVVYDISAYIDGRDLLYLRQNRMAWKHLVKAAVGRWGGRNEPTVYAAANADGRLLGGEAWVPQWPVPPPDEMYDRRADSSVFTRLYPALPSRPFRATLTPVEARHSARIMEQPSAANGYSVVIDFDDTPPDEARVYKVRLTVEYGR